MTTQLTIPASTPGRFGPYGGRYVPETLMVPLFELERAYELAKDRSRVSSRISGSAEEFRRTSHAAAIRFAPHRETRRPAHLPEARRPAATPARTKSTTPSARAFSRVKMGKPRIIAETGAGQHGVASATVGRASRPAMHRVHGHGGHGAPGAQRRAHAHARRGSDWRGIRQPHAEGRHQRSHARLGHQRAHVALSARLGSRRAPLSHDGARFPGGHRA